MIKRVRGIVKLRFRDKTIAAVQFANENSLTLQTRAYSLPRVIVGHPC